MCIKLYVANLAAYNSGRLVGKWLDLEDYSSVDDFMYDVKVQVLGQALNEDGEPEYEYGVSDEEWAIHDYEAAFKISEYEDVETIAAMIEFCALDEHDQKKAAYLFDNGHYSKLQDCIDNVDRVQFYEGMSLADLAYDFFEDGIFGNPKEMGTLANYIDFDKLGRDLGYDGYDACEEGVYYVD